ncbi:bifunctional DNA primase/polymerase [Rhodococcus sp. T2V]|uniref:bifunctional DNA primase/polymerase n=1 Tax=Rhodococcus sp. T2V TaxID=3034164 RepID=UPI0023E20A02|nr:bifunctional DNA primase/polymerase [Rhodococcus sp. T2V]MDF3309889.1 bifunctional DNA primase/polymerase [Rhodococcus sp. T2V]
MIPTRMLDLGFAIGPLEGKKAFLPGGFHDFTTDRAVIERQARRYPRCNWGGTCEGVMFLDEDPRNGGNLEALFESLGMPGIPDTMVIRTGSGGRHVPFRFPGKVRGKLQGHQGIDLKTWRTGYTVMPGSVHPDTGELYRIERDLPIAPLPLQLLPLVEVPNYVPQPTRARPEVRNSGVVRKVAEAQGGGRNAITFWAFCRALERGSSDVVDEIRSAALSTGLEEREIETCLRSAERTTGRAA